MLSLYTIIAYWSWFLMFLVLLPSYFTAKRPSDIPYFALQIPASILLVLGYVLMFNPDIVVLSAPMTPQLGGLGLLLDCIGIGCAIWARVTLHDNWSGLVMSIKKDHQLVQHGPYRFVRHPMYAGLFLATVGTALTIATVGAYAAVALLGIVFLIRIAVEDELMRETFGDVHSEYAARTKRLIPLVW